MNDNNIDKKRMRQLCDLLNHASKVYYQESDEIMSNYEYDRLYDELVMLEKKTGIHFAGSPTEKVGYEVLSELPKERHEKPMLSLDKTKEREELKSFLGNQEALISWKLDGLTIVLTYEDGVLKKAVTRGNGEVGEVITGNARTFQNVPLRIPFTGTLILRGEAVIHYSDFERINEMISNLDARYKNPRNLCSGSVRQLDSSVTKERNVRFYAFSLVRALETDGRPHGFEKRSEQFSFLEEMGFDTVEWYRVKAEDVSERVDYFACKIGDYDIPSDGLVLTYEDLAYSESLGSTAKFPRDSYAFKWADETAETILREIEWSPSRTGLINPVAVFDPVELEGTTVSRASVHNISIVKGLELGIGDMIRVYKANMIIPQIGENLTRSGNLQIPESCPVCGNRTRINRLGDVETLYCDYPDCPVKHLKSFSLMVSRDALNFNGMSEATLEKFLTKGIVKEYRDLFHLEDHKEEIIQMEGFGEKSYEKLVQNAEKARETTYARVLFGLGIPNTGLSTAKLLLKACGESMDKLRCATTCELGDTEGVGPVIAESVREYFASETNNRELDGLLAELKIEASQGNGSDSAPLDGATFVITGSLEHFENRNQLKEKIEALGGKVAGSVSSRTSYLINNDIASASGKNKKAKELGIPVITEEEFLKMVMS